MGESIEMLQELAMLYGVQLILALAIFIVGKWVVKRIASIVQRILAKNNVDPAIEHFVSSLVSWTLLFFVVIASLGQLGIQTASFVAILGAAGLAVGLALQGSLANFAAGVLILIFRPFKVGDFIEVAGVSGVVQKIQIFTTELHSPDNKKIIVPNGGVISGNITNYSANETRRVDMVFGIGYSDDIDAAKAVLQSVVASEPRVLRVPAPTIAVVELADSSVNLVCRPWVNTADYWDVYFNITEAAKKALDAQGISIPFPQRDIHIHNADLPSPSAVSI
ncbi:MAG: mechanosensitive ion channel [Porticoccaceae bacterium]|jgi:small conductance mechanosensitive channel|nr:mechanosensitive ion channel [Porticoccaceae bacterium]